MQHMVGLGAGGQLAIFACSLRPALQSRIGSRRPCAMAAASSTYAYAIALVSENAGMRCTFAHYELPDSNDNRCVQNMPCLLHDAPSPTKLAIRTYFLLRDDANILDSFTSQSFSPNGMIVVVIFVIGRRDPLLGFCFSQHSSG